MVCCFLLPRNESKEDSTNIESRRSRQRSSGGNRGRSKTPRQNVNASFDETGEIAQISTTCSGQFHRQYSLSENEMRDDEHGDVDRSPIACDCTDIGRQSTFTSRKSSYRVQEMPGGSTGSAVAVSSRSAEHSRSLVQSQQSEPRFRVRFQHKTAPLYSTSEAYHVRESKGKLKGSCRLKVEEDCGVACDELIQIHPQAATHKRRLARIVRHFRRQPKSYPH